MKSLKKMVPEFWNYKELVKIGERQEYIFRNKWVLIVQYVCLLTLVPLAISTSFFYLNNREQSIEDLLHETTVLAENSALDVKIFLKQYVTTLQVISSLYGSDALSDTRTLAKVYEQVTATDSQFSFLKFIDEKEGVLAYSGEYIGTDQFMFRNSADEMHDNPSDIGFSCHEGCPSLYVSYRIVDPNGRVYFLRGGIKNDAVKRFMGKMKQKDILEIQLLDQEDRLLTHSRYFGEPGTNIRQPGDPSLSEATMLANPLKEKGGVTYLFSGGASVSGTPLKVGLIVSDKFFKVFMSRIERYLLVMSSLSAFFVFLVVVLLVTYLVHILYRADQVRRECKTQVERTDKLASIGQLAAGVAHEINNPLAIINQKAGLLQDLVLYFDQYKEDKRLLSTVESILGAVDRAGTITHRLLGFARKMDVSVESINVEETLRGVIGFVAKEAENKEIRVEIDVSEDVPEIRTDCGKLQQVVLNLANNAIAAMEKGGLLSISARDNKALNGVTLCVRDDGCGISKEDQQKVFEPFFSTRTRSGGTGLGLTIIHGLVRDLHGIMKLESEVGKGTIFTITLPYEIQAEEIL